MAQLDPLFTAQEINATVQRLAREINKDYKDKNPLLVGILKGCFIFMADLVRNLDIAAEVEFVALSSYGQGKRESSGKVIVVKGLRTPVKGRDILIIEDIVDTGTTLNFFLDYLKSKKPASVKVCALFDKAPRRETEIPIDYLGLSVPDKFIVGYGLDCDEKYRHLPGIYCLEDEG